MITNLPCRFQSNNILEPKICITLINTIICMILNQNKNQQSGYIMWSGHEMLPTEHTPHL